MGGILLISINPFSNIAKQYLSLFCINLLLSIKLCIRPSIHTHTHTHTHTQIYIYIYIYIYIWDEARGYR